MEVDYVRGSACGDGVASPATEVHFPIVCSRERMSASSSSPAAKSASTSAPTHSSSRLCEECVKTGVRWVRDKITSTIKRQHSPQSNGINGSIRHKSFIDMGQSLVDCSMPALIYIAIDNVPSMDIGLIKTISDTFYGPVTQGVRTSCTANGSMPAVCMVGCVLRTLSSEVLEREMLPASLEFKFSFYPSFVALNQPPGIYPCDFSVQLGIWFSSASTSLAQRRRIVDLFPDRQCAHADVALAREMVERAVTTVRGSRVVKPKTIEMFHVSRSLLTQRRLRFKENASSVSAISEANRNRLNCCDLVLKIVHSVPLYLYTAIKKWRAIESEQPGGVAGSQWKLVTIFAERPDIAAGDCGGTFYVGMVFVDRELAKHGCGQRKTKRGVADMHAVSEGCAQSSLGAGRAADASGGNKMRYNNGMRRDTLRVVKRQRA